MLIATKYSSISSVHWFNAMNEWNESILSTNFYIEIVLFEQMTSQRVFDSKLNMIQWQVRHRISYIYTHINIYEYIYIYLISTSNLVAIITFSIKTLCLAVIFILISLQMKISCTRIILSKKFLQSLEYSSHNLRQHSSEITSFFHRYSIYKY